MPGNSAQRQFETALHISALSDMEGTHDPSFLLASFADTIALEKWFKEAKKQIPDLTKQVEMNMCANENGLDAHYLIRLTAPMKNKSAVIKLLGDLEKSIKELEYTVTKPTAARLM